MKQCIPKSLRHAVWMTYIGSVFQAKCYIRWCNANITPFTFEVGHNTPESRGGATCIDNLRPICSQCNKSMGNRYSIDEFTRRFGPQTKKVSWWHPGACCVTPMEVDP